MIRVAFLAWSALAAIGQALFGSFCILHAIADGARDRYPGFATAAGALCIATAITLVLHARNALDERAHGRRLLAAAGGSFVRRRAGERVVSAAVHAGFAAPIASGFADSVGAEFAAACRLVDEAFALPTFGDAARFVSIMAHTTERMPDLIIFALLSRMRTLAGIPL